MGSGKSTLGRELAAQLNYTFVETDSWIETSEQKSISKIFSENGEDHFRRKEKEFLLHAQLLDECIIATGGGMPCFNNNIELMNQMGTTIWLNVEENILVERLQKEKQSRPLLVGDENLCDRVHTLLEGRKLFYQKAKYQIQNPTVESILQLL